LGRSWLGFELSPEYVRQATQRIEQAAVGDALNGAADPLASAPATVNGKQRKVDTPKARGQLSSLSIGSKLIGPDGRAYSDDEAKIVLAYLVAGAGFSADQMLADPELNAAFSDQCRNNGSDMEPSVCFRKLLNLRKAGRLPRVEMRRPRSLKYSDIDAYSFASEIAWRCVESKMNNMSLDEILCDPIAASEFDKIAARYAPGHKPFEYRWAALRIRKRANEVRQYVLDLETSTKNQRLPPSRRLSQLGADSFVGSHGVYVMRGGNGEKLYVGETLDLKNRLSQHERNPFEGATSASVIPMPNAKHELQGLQSVLIGRYQTPLNCRQLAHA
jgi:hypothetical protein